MCRVRNETHHLNTKDVIMRCLVRIVEYQGCDNVVPGKDYCIPQGSEIIKH